jgi:hypothetical protein
MLEKVFPRRAQVIGTAAFRTLLQGTLISYTVLDQRAGPG